MVLVPFWSPKSIKISINIGLVGKSADMRLDRAGSIGLRVGPPQIPPKIQKKRVRNPMRFRSHLFYEKGAQSEPNGLPNGLQNGTKTITEEHKKGQKRDTKNNIEKGYLKYLKINLS